MCTVTFVPREHGYLLAMNRDEKWQRGLASSSPREFSIAGTRVLAPRDVEGGTWIALTEAGDSFALLNRNGGTRNAQRRRSRGEVISALLADPDCVFSGRELAPYLPFTLLSFRPALMTISEMIWDGVSMKVFTRPWIRRHWFSSGISDALAAWHRTESVNRFRSELREVKDVRELHRQHGPRPGPFSFCAHRDDTGTVSYTEIIVDGLLRRMAHASGSPCQGGQLTSLEFCVRDINETLPPSVTRM